MVKFHGMFILLSSQACKVTQYWYIIYTLNSDYLFGFKGEYSSSSKPLFTWWTMEVNTSVM